ncbi:hypothetical protein ABIE28_000684 [Devosia sp. 2618]
MIHVSDALKEWLARQDMSAGPVGAGRAEKAASAPKLGEEEDTNLGTLAYGWEGQPMGMGMGAGTKAPASQQERQYRFGQGRSPVLEVHSNPNLSDMPKRGPTRPQSERMPPLGVGPRLSMIIGGKV